MKDPQIWYVAEGEIYMCTKLCNVYGDNAGYLLNMETCEGFMRLYGIDHSPLRTGRILMGEDISKMYRFSVCIYNGEVTGLRKYNTRGEQEKRDVGDMLKYNIRSVELLNKKLTTVQGLISEEREDINADKLVEGLEKAVTQAVNDSPIYVYIDTNLEMTVFHPLLPPGKCLWSSPENITHEEYKMALKLKVDIMNYLHCL